jgi:LytS/YehU family sensor histidine kinase
MTLLTLVENAVRHGIDPSEEGGRIDVEARSTAARCVLRVTDTGLGLKSSSGGLGRELRPAFAALPPSLAVGTGLSTLRERLQLKFGGDAHLELRAVEPHGACAEIDMPARRAST